MPHGRHVTLSDQVLAFRGALFGLRSAARQRSKHNELQQDSLQVALCLWQRLLVERVHLPPAFAESARTASEAAEPAQNTQVLPSRLPRSGMVLSPGLMSWDALAKAVSIQCLLSLRNLAA